MTKHHGFTLHQVFTCMTNDDVSQQFWNFILITMLRPRGTHKISGGFELWCDLTLRLSLPVIVSKINFFGKKRSFCFCYHFHHHVRQTSLSAEILLKISVIFMECLHHLYRSIDEICCHFLSPSFRILHSCCSILWLFLATMHFLPPSDLCIYFGIFRDEISRQKEDFFQRRQLENENKPT